MKQGNVRVVGAELALLDLERPLEQLELLLRVAELAVGLRVERFDRRGTEPFEPFRTIRTIRILSK